MDRQDINVLFQRRLHLEEPDMQDPKHREAIRHNMLLIMDGKKIVAMVKPDDLFDANGNHFHGYS